MSEENLTEIISGYFKDSNLKLVDLVFRGEKKNKILEVYIDSENGVSIDDITKANAGISEIMDDFQQKNNLNDFSKLIVSSPGVDNNFKFSWQIKKHIGRELIGITNQDIEITGKILEISENGEIVLEKLLNKNKKETEIIKINFSDLKESKIKLKF
ncbi:MAG TPA: hypothetical protein PLG90_05560 [Ignavibacteria bacterium]|nr:hypothetical protein [Ignavibacteria bacterium]